MHMSHEGLGFLEAARRIWRQEGLAGFFAGASPYGLRVALVERRPPTAHELRAGLLFSVGGLRLPAAFAGAGWSVPHLSGGQPDLRLTWSGAFASGFLGAAFSCPSETLMRQSIFSHADYVRGRERHSRFAEQPRYKQVLLRSVALDPVRPERYAAPAALAASSDARALFRGWPVHCTGFGMFFASFCCVYEWRTGQQPSSSWVGGTSRGTTCCRAGRSRSWRARARCFRLTP
ncbi:unnamed protein product [Prorocentrum cordatum]|uniref:Uncharacterized protein n=1 Tax=Prorocentrum cordatum TaxID=2364126 RepID=A0ABN9US82_9DINO|nr:unnamed protein product [Polarella glacialis]